LDLVGDEDCSLITVDYNLKRLLFGSHFLLCVSDLNILYFIKKKVQASFSQANNIKPDEIIYFLGLLVENIIFFKS